MPGRAQDAGGHSRHTELPQADGQGHRDTGTQGHRHVGKEGHEWKNEDAGWGCVGGGVDRGGAARQGAHSRAGQGLVCFSQLQHAARKNEKEAQGGAWAEGGGTGRAARQGGTNAGGGQTQGRAGCFASRSCKLQIAGRKKKKRGVQLLRWWTGVDPTVTGEVVENGRIKEADGAALQAHFGWGATCLQDGQLVVVVVVCGGQGGVVVVCVCGWGVGGGWVVGWWGGGGDYEMFANKTRRWGCFRCCCSSGAPISYSKHLNRLSGSGGSHACRPRDVEVRL